MKNLKKLFLVLFLCLPFFTNGCYTVLWTPDEDFPDESSYDYYGSYYIEEYHYYYDYPWWLSFTPPYKYRDNNEGYERDNGTSQIRNNGNGRGDSGREILVTPPPTINYTPPDNSNDSGNNSNTNSGTTRTESVNSNNSNNSRQDSNSDSGSVRNNDGNRNNGRGR